MVRQLLERRGGMPPAQFEALMDEMVVFAVRLQEQAGIDVISDGEWRRVHYITEFLNSVGGFECCRKFQHQGEEKVTDVVVRRMNDVEPVFVEHARFLVGHTDRATKVALPSPFLVAIRLWHEDYSRDAYPTREAFLEHMAGLLRREAQALAETGVDVIQLDDPALTYFCDRALMESHDSHDERLHLDWVPEQQIPGAVAAINYVLDGLPVETHLHCCHSVYKRRSDVRGDYKPILPRLDGLKADRINLEFAYNDTGSVDDLDLLPAHLGVGMGVLDVRNEHLQSVDEIAALGRAGAERVDAERIALNPDCGFAPDAGEPPSIDEAFEKLSRLAGAAERLRAEHAGE